MKKIILTLVCIATVSVFMVGCSKPIITEPNENTTNSIPSNSESTSVPKEDVKEEIKNETIDLNELMSKVTDNVAPYAVENLPLTEELSENHVRADFKDYDEGVVQMAMISAQAHQIALFKVSKDTDIEQFKTSLQEKNSELPSKWICVNAETILVENHDDIVLLVMTADEFANTYVENFNAAFEK